MQTVKNYYSPLVRAILEHIKQFDCFDCLFFTGDRVLDKRETLTLNKLGIQTKRNESEQIYEINW